MKNVKDFESFNESGFHNYIHKILKKGGTLASDVWEATKREGQETKMCVGILSRMVKGEEISDKEKKFLRAQSMDFVKILPLIAIQGIPIPIPITPFLIILGRKYGFDILPKDNRHLLEDEKKNNE